MNGSVWKGCRRIEAEWYRREKSWWKCWSTRLKSCSRSLSGLVASVGSAKEAVHGHTCGISLLTLLQNFVLFEAWPEWIEVSHRGGSCSSLTLRGQRQRETFGCIDCQKVADAAYAPQFSVGGSADVCDMLVHGCVGWDCDPKMSYMRSKWNVWVTNTNRSGCRTRNNNPVCFGQNRFTFVII